MNTLHNFQIGDSVDFNIPMYGKNQWLNGYKGKVIGITKKNVKIVVDQYPDEKFYVFPGYLKKIEMD